MPSTKPRVLLLTGGNYHDFDGGATIISELLADRFEVTHTTNLEDLALLAEGRFDVLMLYTQGHHDELTDPLAETMQKFVENGGGMVGLHSANASFKENRKYLELIGSRFAGHGPVIDFQVRPTDPEHPVTARTSAFRVTDELYISEPVSDFHPFAVAHWQGVDYPMGYQRDVGKGRVVFLANGHDQRSLGNPYFQRWLIRATRVAAGETFGTTINAGILGYGGAFNMGKQHAEMIRAQPGMGVTAVCDLDPARTEQAKAQLGEEIATFNDMDAFFSEGAFDMVVVILPHHLHAEACIRAAEAGKHAVTEKPFCITLDEADRMIAASEKAGTMMSCFHNRRWNGDFLQLMQLVRSGKIGEVFRIDAASGGYGAPGAWWRSRKEISGGAMYDWGAHFMDWTLNLANKRIKTVTGDFQKRKWHQMTNEDYTYMLLRFEDDSTATLEQGSLIATPRDAWRVLGTEGGIRAGGIGGAVTMVTFDDGTRVESSVPALKGREVEFYANIGNHLITGERLVVTAQQARRVIGAIHLAEQSSAQGGVPLEMPGEDTYEPDYMMPW